MVNAIDEASFSPPSGIPKQDPTATVASAPCAQRRRRKKCQHAVRLSSPTLLGSGIKTIDAVEARWKLKLIGLPSGSWPVSTPLRSGMGPKG